MIIEIRAKNCFSFNEPIAFSLEADMRNKKFISNVHIEKNFNVLKTAGIYGPNNVGKTCLIRCIRAMRDILLNRRTDLISNIFIKNRICELGTTFLYEGRKFSYDLKFESEKREYLYARTQTIKFLPVSLLTVTNEICGACTSKFFTSTVSVLTQLFSSVTVSV